MKINKFDLKYSKKDISLYLKYCESILQNGFIAESTFVKKFENDFKGLQQINHGYLVGSGTDALQVAFNAAKLENQDVLMPANTFVATYIAAHLSGANIKLIDVNPADGIISFSDIVKNTTKKTKAVCIVHIGGHITKEIFKIKKFCNENNIILIEDAAHCVGSSRSNIYAGSFGDYGCFSFYPTKSLTMGEGGFVSFNNPTLENDVYGLKNFGRTTKIEDEHNILGYNMKVTESQAALGLVDIQRFSSRLNKRRALFEVYLSELKSKYIDILHSSSFLESSCYKIIMKSEKTLIDEVENLFKKNHISMTGKVYSKQIGSHKAFSNEKTFTNAQQFIDTHFCPPLYPELTKTQIKFICKVLNKAF